MYGFGKALSPEFASSLSEKYKTSNLELSNPVKILSFNSPALSSCKSKELNPSLSVSQKIISFGFVAVAASKTSTVKVPLYSVLFPQSSSKVIFKA